MGILGTTASATTTGTASTRVNNLSDIFTNGTPASGDRAYQVGNAGAGSGVTLSQSSSWTNRATDQGTTNNVKLNLYSQTLTGTDITTDAETITLSAARSCAALLICVNGFTEDSLSALQESGGSGTYATTATIPSVTPSVDNCILLAFITYSAGTTNSARSLPLTGGWSAAPGTSSVATTDTGNRITTLVATKTLGASTAGVATGTTTLTYASSLTGHTLIRVVVLKPAATPPVAHAGSDQADVEPFVTVNLSGSGATYTSPDTGVTHAWTQQSGSPTVTLSSSTSATPTFPAPATIAGTTLVFRDTVTGNSTGLSAHDDVSVEILPHTFLWKMNGGGTAIGVPLRVVMVADL